MKLVIRYLLSSLIIGSSMLFGGLTSTQAQPGQTDLSKVDVNYVYNPEAPVQINSRVAKNDTDAVVFLQVISRPGITLPTVQYEIRADYTTETVLSTQSLVASQLIKEEGEAAYYRVIIPLQENASYMFLYVTLSVGGAELPMRFDVALDNDQNFPLSSLLLMRESEDIPVFSNYIPQDQSVRLVSLDESDSVAYSYYYGQSFDANPPPLSTRREAQQKLTVDSLLRVSLDAPMSFENKGLYFVQLDTTSLSGISFRVEDAYYPRLVRVEELTEPLRYISTSEEVAELEDPENPKLALDSYWIRVARSQERAKMIIRDYYQQVAKANQLFTTYKEGWKTGMGMIYTLYGKPDDVYRDGDKEVWIYAADNNLVNTSFTFTKVKNIFTDQHYNLMRDEDFKRFWFRNIDLWRKGRKTL
ncbi:MAG: GWxTD domain-containing protein [Bacteroidota bacterium]